MTDQPERVDGAGSAKVPDAAQPPAPPPAPTHAPAAPPAPAPVPTTWGAPAAAPTPASSPAPAGWGAQAAPTGPAPAPTQPAPAPTTWGAPAATSAAPGAWGARPAPGSAPVAAAGLVPGWGGGTAPAPVPSRPRGTSWKATVGVLAVILVVVFGANIVDAALPLPDAPSEVDPGPALPQDPGQPEPTQRAEATEGPGQPVPGASAIPIQTLAPLGTAAPVDPGPVSPGAGVDVGAGFVLYPADGWSAVGGTSGLTVFQKGNVAFIVGGIPWDGTASDLAVQYRDAWFAAGQLTGDDPQSGSIGNGIPAAGINYTGTLNGTQVDGAIVAGSRNGSGLVVNYFGASGSLNAVGNDLDQMLKTIQHTGG